MIQERVPFADRVDFLGMAALEENDSPKQGFLLIVISLPLQIKKNARTGRIGGQGGEDRLEEMKKFVFILALYIEIWIF